LRIQNVSQDLFLAWLYTIISACRQVSVSCYKYSSITRPRDFRC